jgi:hypothetical protein
MLKTLRVISIFLAVGCGWLADSALAGDTNVTAKSTVSVLSPNTSKLPAPIQSLLSDYQAAREKYLARQQALLDKLKGATAAQREQIRAQLQADRQAFLLEVAAFRQQLREEIAELQLKIHNAELNRLLGAGQSGTGHKGH